MKALSIQQPWAWLIVNGHKDLENRDWPTKRTGPIYIHAGKKLDKDAIDYIKLEYPDVTLPDTFELGGIVGTAVITDCVTTSKSRWFYGDYGFLMARAKPLPFRPYRGQLGFFEVVEEDQLEQATTKTTAKATTAS